VAGERPIAQINASRYPSFEGRIFILVSHRNNWRRGVKIKTIAKFFLCVQGPTLQKPAESALESLPTWSRFFLRHFGLQARMINEAVTQKREYTPSSACLLGLHLRLETII
jgi:hypothetical protein